MRRVLRPLIALAVLAVFAVPSLASAAGTATVPTRHLTAKGGAVSGQPGSTTPGGAAGRRHRRLRGSPRTVKCESGVFKRSFSSERTYRPRRRTTHSA